MDSTSGAALLERDQIDALIEVAGAAGVRDILSAFWRSSDMLTNGLTSHLAANNGDEAAKVAHALKGSAANVGAALLADSARDVEHRCKTGEIEEARKSLLRLIDIYAETRAALEAHLRAHD